MTNDAQGSEPAGPAGADAAGSAGFEDEREPQVRILVALAKIGAALRARAWHDPSPRGLNPTQSQVLALLLRGDPGGLGLTHLADQLGVSPPTMSDSVSALERKGLVAKKPKPGDGRRTAVQLTRSGRSEARKISQWPQDLLASVETLDGDEQAAMLRSLVTLIRALQLSGQIAPARTCVSCCYFQPNAHGDVAAPHHCAFVDAAFGDASLRLDCMDHEAAGEAAAKETWERFSTTTS